MKKKYDYCVKCGKELSSVEKEKGSKKCENCLGKKAKKTKGILSVIVSFFSIIIGAILYFLSRGKKGKI